MQSNVGSLQLALFGHNVPHRGGILGDVVGTWVGVVVGNLVSVDGGTELVGPAEGACSNSAIGSVKRSTAHLQ